MLHALLPDEQAFVGATWGSAKGLETCLFTTDSRIFGGSGEASSWVLGATLSRFSLPAVMVSETSVVSQRGGKDSAKLVKYEPGNHAETVTIDLKAEVAFIRPLVRFNAVLLVFKDGSCECRSGVDLKQVSERLSPIKDKAEVVSIFVLTSESLGIIVLANGATYALRFSGESSGQVKLERSGLQGGALEASLKVLSACVSETSTLLVTLVHKSASGDGVRALTRAYDLNSLELIRAGAPSVFKLPEGANGVAGAPGARLICFNRAELRVEAWDTYHGLMLDSWPLEASLECTFLSVSPSGRTVAVGSAKQVKLITVNTEMEAPSLARALCSRLKRVHPVQVDLTGVDSKPKRKRRGSKHEEEDDAPAKEGGSSCVDLSRVAAAQSKFIADGNWSAALKGLVSTRHIGGDDLLVKALVDGHADWCVRVLRTCPDVAPAQIANLIHALLRLVSGEDDSEKAALRKGVEAYGKTLPGGEDALGLDRGLAGLVFEGLSYAHGVEMEVLEVLSEELTAPEEGTALIACLLFIAERTAVNKSDFDRALRAATFALDAKPIVRLREGPARVLSWLKQVVSREITLCDKFDQLCNRVTRLIEDAEAGNGFALEPGEEYRTETVRF